MDTLTMRREALSRATQGQSTGNYATIINGFAAKGIPMVDINPRENVLTYHAWLALGRQVRKGEHGVKVHTWIPVKGKPDPITGEPGPGHKVCKSATVFHVSQTDPVGD